MFFVELLGFEQAAKHCAKHLQLLPQPGFAPGAQQGGANLPVDETDFGALFPGRFGCRRQFGAGLDSGLQPHAFLKSGKRQIGQQKGALALADRLDQVEGLPSPGVGQ